MQDYANTQRLTVLELESLEERRTFQDLVLLYQICHELFNANLQDSFSFNTLG